MEYLPPSEDKPPEKPARRSASGIIGTAGAALVAFALKFKLLLFFGFKLLTPTWTFLLSLWIYVVLFGWRLALVVMLVLLAHELGHYFAFRAYGLPVRLPSFIPLLGAFTAGTPAANLEDDAYIALAGPLTGLGLAAVCFAIAVYTKSRFWYACADVSAFLNLFNMIPMPPFDGGRITAALWAPLWFVGFGLFIGAAVYLHLPIVFVAVIGLLGVPTMLAAWRGEKDPRAAAMTFQARLRVSLWYMGTLVGLLLIVGRAHAAASVGAW